jgi:signal recognition particle subunit SRP68
VRNAELVDIVIKVKKAILSLEADKDLGSGGKKNNTREQRTSKGRKEILGARRMGTYDKALLVLSDAEVVAKQLLDDNKVCLPKLHSQ